VSVTVGGGGGVAGVVPVPVVVPLVQAGSVEPVVHVVPPIVPAVELPAVVPAEVQTGSVEPAVHVVPVVVPVVPVAPVVVVPVPF
jgi:hypothetical protein